MAVVGFILIAIGVILSYLGIAHGFLENFYSEIFGIQIQYTFIIGGLLIIVGILLVYKSWKNR